VTKSTKRGNKKKECKHGNIWTDVETNS